MHFVLIGAVESTRVALECSFRFGVLPKAVVTLPIAKMTRHSDFVDLRPMAGELNVPIIEVSSSNDPGLISQLVEYELDYVLVIGWSQILKKAFFSVARKGLIGYHPARLPENRGRAVIPWTILQRKQETGATLFWLDEGVDSGDILLQHVFNVEVNETARTLYQKHLQVLDRLLTTAIPMLQEDNAPRLPQDHSQATYCAKRTADDGLIDWSCSAEEIWTLIRAVTRPYPGAFTFYRGKRLILWETELIGGGPFWGLPGQVQRLSSEGALIQCGDGQHILASQLQFEGETPKPAAEVLKLHDRLGINWPKLYQQLQL